MERACGQPGMISQLKGHSTLTFTARQRSKLYKYQVILPLPKMLRKISSITLNQQVGKQRPGEVRRPAQKPAVSERQGWDWRGGRLRASSACDINPTLLAPGRGFGSRRETPSCPLVAEALPTPQKEWWPQPGVFLLSSCILLPEITPRPPSLSQLENRPLEASRAPTKLHCV